MYKFQIVSAVALLMMGSACAVEPSDDATDGVDLLAEESLSSNTISWHGCSATAQVPYLVSKCGVRAKATWSCSNYYGESRFIRLDQLRNGVINNTSYSANCSGSCSGTVVTNCSLSSGAFWKSGINIQTNGSHSVDEVSASFYW